MKRFNIKYFVLGIALAISASSCDSYLDIKPTDLIDDSKAFETVDDLEKGMIGVYGSLNNHGTVQLSSRSSDNLRLSTQNRGQGVQLHNWTYTSGTGEFLSTFRDMYHTIDRANRVLEACHKFDQSNALVTKVKGEALFVRAYAHFELIRQFSKAYSANDADGLPYMFESLISQPARISQGEFYTNLLTDLNQAHKLLMGNNDDFSRGTELGLMALKTKINLYQNDWDGVIESANSVINNDVGLRLAELSEVDELWNDAAPSDVENLFYLRRTIGSSLLGSLFTAVNGDIFFHPAFDLMNQYEANDVRYTSYFGQDGNGEYIVKKHDGRADGETNLVHYKALRLSEVYLMRAEAYAQKSMLLEAASDINTIRGKRIPDVANLIFKSKDEAMTAVMLERRRELAYEGNRFFDLKRWDLGIERIPEDSQIASNSELEAGNYRFVYPIPQQEIFANENMVQNDGYSNE